MKSKNTKQVINKIYNKDARELLTFLGTNIRVKSTITSPPYFDMKDYGSNNQIGFGQSYDEYLDDLKDIFSKILKITSDDGSLWIIIDTFKRDNHVVTLPFDLSAKLKETGWLLQDIIIWKKDKTVPWSKNGFFQRKFEYILFFTKSTQFKYNKDKVRNYDTNQLKKWWVKYPERYNPKGKALDEIWEFPIPVQGSWGDQYIKHFCPLPKEMVATMIEISSEKNDLILDPFSGSGSVLFQSAVMDRNYIGFELNNDYIQMFDNYFSNMLEKAKAEHEKLDKPNNQSEFKKRILELRALKYGRLLINKLEEQLNLDLKIFVKIKEFLNDDNKFIKVEYQIIGKLATEVQTTNNLINEIIQKAPFSKFGIMPIFILKETKEINKKEFYGYTKSNSYCYSELPKKSSKIKVISDIRVNLKENDYN